MSTLVHSVPFSSFPTGDNSELVLFEHSASVAEFDRNLVLALRICREPASLVQQQQRVVRALGIDQATAASLIARLERNGCLRDSGLGAPSPSPAPRLRIGAFGVVTANRPEALRICLSSYLENFRRWDHRPGIVVSDDSAQPAIESANRALCRQIAASYGYQVNYFGNSEKQAFAASLVQAGLDPADASLALGPCDGGCSIGANRNFMLLRTIGMAIVSVDDDTRCATWSLASSAPAEIMGHEDPTDSFFFHNRAEAVAAAAISDHDFLGAHESMLGRSLPDVCAESTAAPVRTDRACSHLVSGDGDEWRVRLTMSSIAGDSGNYSPRRILFCGGDTRDRLSASEEAYRLALTSREVVRGVRRPSLTHSSRCMTTAIGMDNRAGLPPFMPQWRNQDGVFGSSLAHTDPRSLFGYLPVGIVHDSDRPSRFQTDQFEYARSTRISELLILLMDAAPMSPSNHPAFRLRSLAAHLSELGELDLHEFGLILRRAVLAQGCRMLRGFSRAVLQFSYPDYWKHDFDRYQHLLRASLLSNEALRPVEFRSDGDAAHSIARVRQYVRTFARLLARWPLIAEASADVARLDSAGHTELLHAAY